MEFISLRNKAF